VIGDTRRSVAYSRLGRKARLAAWVELLALTAAHPDRTWRAVTLGRGMPDTKGPDGDRAVASMSTLACCPPRELGGKKRSRIVDNPLGPPDGPADARRDAALELLDQLVQLRASGLCGPLLLPCETAGAYAETAWGKHVGWHGRGAAAAARSAWSNTSGFGRPGEDEDHAHRLVLGALTADELLELPPEDDECGPGWDDDPSRLGRLGRRVWWPLLAAEEIEHR
jgi:exodeoxyribonuclease V gamma subunit